MTALFAAATAIGLAILVVVVIRVDTDLRWSAMSEALLEQAQAGAGAVVVDDGVDVDRFLSDATLTGGWPQVWIYEADGDEAFPAAGPVDDWYDAELDGYAAAVIFDGARWVEEVEADEANGEIYARGVPIADSDGDVVAASVAVVAADDFFSDHDRLVGSVVFAAALLVALAAVAGYWLAGRGTRATADVLAQQERLLADAAHELRTPVARIRAVAESGLAGDEPTRDALERVADLGEDAGQMVDDMLFLARIDAEREEPDFEPLRLDLLVEEIASRYPGVSVDAVETIVDGDAGLLRRAISNLIGNATTHGGGDVTVTVYPTRVIVADRGSGIDPAVAGHLFDRFHSGPESTGHGLGLPIVRWVASVHGGDVRIENRDGGGAEATLLL
jgi:two-component system OmpR family sensor kinase